MLEFTWGLSLGPMNGDSCHALEGFSGSRVPKFGVIVVTIDYLGFSCLARDKASGPDPIAEME